MSDDVTILCTRTLEQELLSEAASRGVRIICEPFITTGAVDELEVQQEVELISQLETAVIFTSARAVEIVKDLLSIPPLGWTIYCIGHHTRETVEKYFGAAIAGTGDDGAELSEKIIEDGVEEAFFFCGNKRMDTIPVTLKEHGVSLTEIVVYNTIEIPHRITFSYSGVMFFSPSAVRSFFNKNRPGQEVIMFCIGDTTAAEVRRFAGNMVILPSIPTAEEMINEVTGFFT